MYVRRNFSTLTGVDLSCYRLGDVYEERYPLASQGRQNRLAPGRSPEATAIPGLKTFKMKVFKTGLCKAPFPLV